jgi:hypothetical protein
MTTETDEFADAFNALAAGEELPPEKTKKPEEAVAKTPDEGATSAGVKTLEEEASAAKTSEEETVTTNTPEEEAAASETAAVKTPEEEAVAAKTAAEAAAAEAAAEKEELRARLAALEASTKAPEATPAEKPIYTDAEKAILAKYEEDWPDVAAGEALKRRAEYRDLVRYVFDQVQQVYGPLLDYYQVRSAKDHYAEIKNLVPDYDEVRDKAIAWVETQPAYLKAAFTQVVESGSAEEVADLIARFKKDTGYAAPAKAPAAAVVPSGMPAGKELPPAAKKAAAALKVVETGRTEQTSGVDPNDFDAAFKEFSAAAR